MNFFSRGAEWLRHFFPSSSAARITVGQLDSTVSPTFDFAGWSQFAQYGLSAASQSGVGATGSKEWLAAAGPGFANLILAGGIEVDVATNPTLVWAAISHPRASASLYPLGEPVDSTNWTVGDIHSVKGVNWLLLPDPIVLYFLYKGGGAASQMTARAAYVKVPIGTTPPRQ